MKWKLFNKHDTLEILDEKNTVIVKWQGFDGLNNAENIAESIVKSHNLTLKIGDMLKTDVYMVEQAAFASGKINKFEKRIKEYKQILMQIVKLDSLGCGV